MATASAGLLVALAQDATAAPNCTGTGGPDTCIIDLTNIATESVDAGLNAPSPGVDKLQFNAAGLTLNTNTIGAALGGSVRFANFEAAQITAGSDLTLTGASTFDTQNLAWTIDLGGSLFARGGNAIGNGSAVTVNGSLEIGGGGTPADESIGSLAGSGGVSILNSKILTVGLNGTNTTFSGIISGNGGLTKEGGGTQTLTGDNNYSGATNVGNGTLEIGHAGAIDQSTSVTTSSAGWIRGTVAYTIGGTVSNAGAIEGNVTFTNTVSNNGVLRPGLYVAPTPPSTALVPSFGQMNLNAGYASTGSFAVFDMDVNIDTATPAPVNGTTHDIVNINGNVTGTPTTFVFLREFDAAADTAGATTGNGIQLINIAGTNTPGQFIQRNALTSGAFQYLLRYVANHTGAEDGYFLQSAARDELIAHAGLLSAGQSLIRGCFRDDQRIPDSPKNATYGRAWFGYRQGSNSFGADTGVEQDQDYSCTTGGMDWRMGSGWFGGVSGGFGSSEGDIVVPSGNAQLDGDARVIEAYAAFTSSAFFLNLSAGYADMDWNLAGRLASSAASSSGFIGSAQAGVGLGLEPLAVKLIGMVNYDGTNCGEDCFGIAVSEDTGLIEAKAALRFDGVTWGGSIRPWAQVAYSTVISDGVNTIAAGPFTIVSDTNDELLTIDAGLQAYLDENLALYLDGGYNESLGKDISGYRAGIGAKLYW
jgi:autotransporter-associated beta strand protein